METSLRVLRSQIINLLFNGPQPDDSQLKTSFFNQLILDARAEAILLNYVQSKQLDDELYTSAILDVTKVSNTFGTSYTATLPQLVKLPSNINLKVKGTGNDLNHIVYYELIKKQRIPYYKKNVYSNGDPVCCRTGDKLEIFSKKDIKKIEIEAIIFDPTTIDGFTQDSPFPVNVTTINTIKKIISSLDINMLIRGEKDNANDSLSFISRAETPQNQE